MMQMGNYFPYMPQCYPAISEAMSLVMLNRHHKQARTWWEPLAHWVGLGNTYWSVKWQWSPALQWLAFKYLLLSTKPLALLFLQKKTVGIVVIPPQETLAGKQVLPTNHVSAAFSNSELSSSHQHMCGCIIKMGTTQPHVCIPSTEDWARRDSDVLQLGIEAFAY